MIDIVRDRRGEYFDIQAGDGANIQVLDVQPNDRHLLLMVSSGPTDVDGGSKRWRGAADYAMHVIADIGRAAEVRIDADKTTGRQKYATAHDLRRAFGERWAARVMPPVVMELMRHKSITTTLKYYVGRNAQRTAQQAWDAYKNLRAEECRPQDKSRDSLRDTGPIGGEDEIPRST